MQCIKCRTKMSGPARDYEDILLNNGKKVYYDVWSCPKCMEVIINDVPVEEPWSIS